MIRLHRIAAGVACFLASSTALASPLVRAVCVERPGIGGAASTWTFSSSKLRRHALAGVSFDTLDANRDGNISEAEEIAALTDEDFCTIEASMPRAVPCTDQEGVTVLAAQNTFSGIVAAPTGLTINPTQSPTQAQISAEPWLGGPGAPLLDRQGRFANVTCTPPQQPVSPSAGSLIPPRQRHPRILVNREPQQLGLNRAGDRIRAIPQAEISFVRDNVADTDTWRVNGTIGVSLSSDPTLRIIPHVQTIQSDVVDRTGEDEDQETSKLAVGLLAGWTFNDLTDVDLAALYANDHEDGLQVLSGTVAVRPGFLYRLPSFGAVRYMACNRRNADTGGCVTDSALFTLITDFQFLASGGHVLEIGDNPSLAENRDFLRLGFEGRVTIAGHRGLLNHFSLDASWRQLWAVAGLDRDFTNVSFGMNYWIAGSDHFSLRFGYESRRDEETLKETDQLTAGFGVRF